jgi:hypothetical protein
MAPVASAAPTATADQISCAGTMCAYPIPTSARPVTRAASTSTVVTACARSAATTATAGPVGRAGTMCVSPIRAPARQARTSATTGPRPVAIDAGVNASVRRVERPSVAQAVAVAPAPTMRTAPRSPALVRSVPIIPATSVRVGRPTAGRVWRRAPHVRVISNAASTRSVVTASARTAAPPTTVAATRRARTVAASVTNALAGSTARAWPGRPGRRARPVMCAVRRVPMARSASPTGRPASTVRPFSIHQPRGPGAMPSMTLPNSNVSPTAPAPRSTTGGPASALAAPAIARVGSRSANSLPTVSQMRLVRTACRWARARKALTASKLSA